jgi:hypothetical protein
MAILFSLVPNREDEIQGRNSTAFLPDHRVQLRRWISTKAVMSRRVLRKRNLQYGL